ncbi:HI0933 family protein [Thalassoporum mexicanum PCC 7367]|uniref:NAD(P)/FAD-dependent oxidoreductase n=1 Tax=Thalassoporum mexicanum TaxID=3457544 RepID=UPI00029FBE20|nr:NAD(P)/FAD-dependent oxidoreductase [Pseudanabaena sp. PCC 7367]AFY69865.1 HI0933 family protein [Pseudanabaena sp. PCC 7367]
MRVIVVGGGAAGFFGAIACARANPLAQVKLFEAGSKPLAKVLISGGGRCNVTHACFDPAKLVEHYPRGGREMRGALSRFQPRDLVQWFEHESVLLKTEADGRMFPTTDDSSTIADCLINAARQAGVEIYTRSPVVDVQANDHKFLLTLRSGQEVIGDRLLLATGGSPQGYQLAQQLGHEIIAPVPSLFTFNINDPKLHQLAGVSVEQVQASIKALGTIDNSAIHAIHAIHNNSSTIALTQATNQINKQPQPTRNKKTTNKKKPADLTQSGPLLITHWGMSGPAVLKLSAWGARFLSDRHYQAQLQINWLPNLNSDQIRQQLLTTKQQFPKRQISSYCPFNLPKRLWQYLLMGVAIAADLRWADLAKTQINQLITQLNSCEQTIAGKGVFKEEFVTCGGVSLKEVDFKTMQSRICPDLFFAGEVLDIDGVTGGFNFQSAWTTAWLAGNAIANL